MLKPLTVDELSSLITFSSDPATAALEQRLLIEAADRSRPSAARARRLGMIADALDAWADTLAEMDEKRLGKPESN